MKMEWCIYKDRIESFLRSKPSRPNGIYIRPDTFEGYQCFYGDLDEVIELILSGGIPELSL